MFAIVWTAVVGVHRFSTKVLQQSLRCKLAGDTLLKVVAIQAGSNDLCNIACSPERVVEDLLSFTLFLVERHNVHRVIVCQIL